MQSVDAPSIDICVHSFKIFQCNEKMFPSWIFYDVARSILIHGVGSQNFGQAMFDERSQPVPGQSSIVRYLLDAHRIKFMKKHVCIYDIQIYRYTDRHRHT